MSCVPLTTEAKSLLTPFIHSKLQIFFQLFHDTKCLVFSQSGQLLYCKIIEIEIIAKRQIFQLLFTATANFCGLKVYIHFFNL